MFRSTVLDVWRRANLHFTENELDKVIGALEIATRDTISGYVLKQAAFREQFFAALTHDLRTPIGTAKMAVELIGEATDAHRVQMLAKIVEKQLGLMSRMVDDLLDTMIADASATKSLEFAATDMHALSEEVIANTALTSHREIRLSGGPAIGMWCESALRRAMENLLNNAVKYSEEASLIEADISTFDGRTVWKVTNKGNAIPEDQTEGLFQLFRRVEYVGSQGKIGWGIGLPYVRSVAERHAGSVVVTSNAEETSFAIDIPDDPRPILAAAPHATV